MSDIQRQRCEMLATDEASSNLPLQAFARRAGKSRDQVNRNIELAAFNADDRKEREFQLELGYVIQSGPLKNVGLMARKSIYRNDFPGGAAFRDENQTRFLVLYTVALW